MLSKDQIAGHGLTALIVLGGASVNMQTDPTNKRIHQDVSEIKGAIQLLSKGMEGFKQEVNGQVNLINYRLGKVEEAKK